MLKRKSPNPDDRQLTINGVKFAISDAIQIEHTTGYQWKNYWSANHSVTWSKVGATETDQLPDDIYCLNPSNLMNYLKDYHYDNHQLYQQPGILQHSSKPLAVYITSTLSQHQWAQLLAAAKIHNTSLQLYLAPDITLPETLEEAITLQPLPNSAVPDNNTKASAQVITTNDISYTVEQLCKDKKIDKIMTISECDAADLLYRMD